ncbi:amidohydrolase family protein [Acidobacteria bacterium AH-259-D05]|nr:amidohydrolase family protein [Acidobacteria bacterium AH-259-D05]
MNQKTDIFCHILPPRYEKAKWEHSDDFVDHSPSHLAYVGAGKKPPANYQSLIDLDTRFRIMDEFENYQQVLSVVSPPIEVIAAKDSAYLASILNDELAELVEKHPDYFVGAVASIPMNKPEAAAKELERAIKQLDLNGVQLYSNVRGKPLDLPEFRPIFQMMSDFNLPILLHPARSQKHFDYPTESTSKYLIWQVFGWPYESTAAMARLIFSGILDEFPNLKIVVHHTGAMVPFFQGRIQAMYTLFEPQWTQERGGPLQKPLLEYFRSFYCDTSTFTSASIDCACDFFGVDQVLFGTDMPLDVEGGRFSVRESTVAVENSRCSEEDKEKIFHRNCGSLFDSAVAMPFRQPST